MQTDIKWIGNITPTKTRDNPNQGRVYDVNGICPTITNLSGGGNLQPMVIVHREENVTDGRTKGDKTWECL